jgi:hypothetical protein
MPPLQLIGVAEWGREHPASLDGPNTGRFVFRTGGDASAGRVKGRPKNVIVVLEFESRCPVSASQPRCAIRGCGNDPLSIGTEAGTIHSAPCCILELIGAGCGPRPGPFRSGGGDNLFSVRTEIGGEQFVSVASGAFASAVSRPDRPPVRASHTRCIVLGSGDETLAVRRKLGTATISMGPCGAALLIKLPDRTLKRKSSPPRGIPT